MPTETRSETLPTDNGRGCQGLGKGATGVQTAS